MFEWLVQVSIVPLLLPTIPPIFSSVLAILPYKFKSKICPELTPNNPWFGWLLLI